MADLNTGKLTQIIGAVLDIKFPEGELPEINDAINVPLKDGKKLVVEVSQHLGDDTVRCIAMGPTDGLVRGMEAQATGGPIKKTSLQRQRFWKLASKSLTCSAHIRRVVRLVCSAVPV